MTKLIRISILLGLASFGLASYSCKASTNEGLKEEGKGGYNRGNLYIPAGKEELLTFRQSYQKDLDKIIEERKDLLKSETPKTEFDKVFTHPTHSSGFSKDIFDVFNKERTERSGYVKARTFLPDNQAVLMDVRIFTPPILMLG